MGHGGLDQSGVAHGLGDWAAVGHGGLGHGVADQGVAGTPPGGWGFHGALLKVDGQACWRRNLAQCPLEDQDERERVAKEGTVWVAKVC